MGLRDCVDVAVRVRVRVRDKEPEADAGLNVRGALGVRDWVRVGVWEEVTVGMAVAETVAEQVEVGRRVGLMLKDTLRDQLRLRLEVWVWVRVHAQLEVLLRVDDWLWEAEAVRLQVCVEGTLPVAVRVALADAVLRVGVAVSVGVREAENDTLKERGEDDTVWEGDAVGLLERVALTAPVGLWVALHVAVGVPVTEADCERSTDWERVIEHVTVSDVVQRRVREAVRVGVAVAVPVGRVPDGVWMAVVERVCEVVDEGLTVALKDVVAVGFEVRDPEGDTVRERLPDPVSDGESDAVADCVAVRGCVGGEAVADVAEAVWDAVEYVCEGLLEAVDAVEDGLGVARLTVTVREADIE